jgi:hypothetical protein
MVQFFETIMGRRFFEGHVPKLLRELERLNNNLEASNKSLEPQPRTMRGALIIMLDRIFDEEIAGHFDHDFIEVVIQLIEYEHNPNKDRWKDNKVQFARLLCELVATHENIDVKALAESMDLRAVDVDELFDRAQHVWETAKEQARDE